MILLTQWFKKKCLNLKIHSKIYIGYSGGIDSSVLLHLCINFFNTTKSIRVIHINHSFSKTSKIWELFCKRICDKLNIPIHTYILDTLLNLKTSEEKLRNFRFNAFSKKSYKNSTLFLAHNKNDFFETMFLNLFRGTGLFGITGIKEQIKINNLNILRPLLLLERKFILKYAEENDIPYIIDFSNFNNKIDRNFIRNKIIPLINKNWTTIDKSLFNHSILSNQSYTYIYNKCKFFLYSKGFNMSFLSIKYLLTLPKFLRYEIIRLWIKGNNYKMPFFSHLKEIDKFLITTKKNTPYISIDTYIIRKLKNNLYINKKIIKITTKKNLYFFYKSIKKLNFLDFDITYKKKQKYYENNTNLINIKYKKLILIIPGFWIAVKQKFLIKKQSIIRKVE